MPQPLTGRLQMYLVLGALANRDVINTPVFRDNSTVGEGRAIMYGNLDVEANQKDYETFRDRAKQALRSGGFSDDFIDAINWPNFRIKGVWKALKLLNDELQLLEEPYEGTDCPCMSMLSQIAVVLEKELEGKRKLQA